MLAAGPWREPPATAAPSGHERRGRPGTVRQKQRPRRPRRPSPRSRPSRSDKAVPCPHAVPFAGGRELLIATVEAGEENRLREQSPDGGAGQRKAEQGPRDPVHVPADGAKARARARTNDVRLRHATASELRAPKRRSRRGETFERLEQRVTAEIRPQRIHEQKFRIGRLPEQEVGKPPLARGADHQIRLGQRAGEKPGGKKLRA